MKEVLNMNNTLNYCPKCGSTNYENVWSIGVNSLCKNCSHLWLFKPKYTHL